MKMAELAAGRAAEREGTTLAGSAAPAARGSGNRPIRIRTGHSYHIDLTVALEQRNATFVKRALTPLARLVSWKWVDAVTFLPEPGFEAIHTWNAVPFLTRRPYVVTFEDFLPRTPEDRRIAWLERDLRERLLHDRCVGIVACSRYAVRQVRKQHGDWARLPELLAKMQVIYPVAAARRASPKPHSDRLRLLFVGRDFMRKGGPAVLRAHGALRAMNVPIETTIVSSLGWSPTDYVGPPDRRYVEEEMRGLAQERVVHHRTLPPAEVHRLMDAADYLVFPTFHETFGFVSVEALAGGTPVIATDTCALPEVVDNGRNGWLLPFENDAIIGKWTWLYRNAEPGYMQAYAEATERLAGSMTARLAQAWEGRRDYEALSAGALDVARTRFSPEIARDKLERLYEGFRRRV